jgi:hypothetical protein
MVETNQEGAISVMFILMYVCGAARFRVSRGVQKGLAAGRK